MSTMEVEKFDTRPDDDVQEIVKGDFTICLKWKVDDGNYCDMLEGTFTSRLSSKDNDYWIIDIDKGYLLYPEGHEEVEETYLPEGTDDIAICNFMELIETLQGTDNDNSDKYHRFELDDGKATVTNRIAKDINTSSRNIDVDFFVTNVDWDEDQTGDIARRIWDRVRDYYNDHWCYMGCIVEVLFEGDEIGSSSVWGIESDGDRDYIKSVIQDQVYEAIAEANKTIRKLQSAALIMEGEDYV